MNRLRGFADSRACWRKVEAQEYRVVQKQSKLTREINQELRYQPVTDEISNASRMLDGS
jgi:hypothetical protein